MANLVEKYAKRVSLAESIYAKKHNGEQMDSLRKLTIATCLNN